MGAFRFDRRRFGFAAVAAGVSLLGGAVKAQMVSLEGHASRLPLPPDNPETYEPPADLKTVLDIYRRMTCPVRLAGSGPYQFVVDTGANQSVISTELAAELGLALGPSQPLNGVAGMKMTPTVACQLQLGSRPPKEATLSVLAASAIGGEGMLGLDQLDDARLTLDFFRETLTIDSGPALPGLGVSFDMKAERRDGPLTLVDANLAGIPVTAFLDSGAQDTIGNMALRQVAITRYPLASWSRIPIYSVTGQTVLAEFADLPAFRIGGVTLPTWPIAFADLHIFRLWDLIDRPAILLGVDVLSRFETICLDFRHDEVRFRLPGRA